MNQRESMRRTDALLKRVQATDGGGARSTFVTGYLPPLVLGVILLLVWYAVSIASGSSLLPSPGVVLVQTVENLLRPDFLVNVGSTLKLLVISYVLTIVIGTIVGFLTGMTPFGNKVATLFFFVLYSIPNVALFPLYLILLGISDVTQVVFAFAHGFFPMALVVLGAMKTVPQTRLMYAASLRLGYGSLFRRITIPSLLASITTGMRMSFGLVFIGLILGEMLFGQEGLGYELVQNIAFARMDEIISIVVVIGVIALVPTGLLRALESRSTRRFGS